MRKQEMYTIRIIFQLLFIYFHLFILESYDFNLINNSNNEMVKKMYCCGPEIPIVCMKGVFVLLNRMNSAVFPAYYYYNRHSISFVVLICVQYFNNLLHSLYSIFIPYTIDKMSRYFLTK